MASQDSEGDPYEVETYLRHLVATYTGLNFNEIGQLNYIDFLQYRRDAYIQRCMSTQEGRNHLHECWRFEQTKPDREKLRRTVGKEAGADGQ